MRPIAFQKGRLVIEFPTAYVNAVTGYEARKSGSRWCVRLETGIGEIIGAGHFRCDHGDVLVDGGRVENLPDWWNQGEKMIPEPWDVVALFGRSGTSVLIGSDDTPSPVTGEG